RYANVRDKSAKTFGWGSEHSCNDGYKVTAPVGQFKANAFGLHDMLGNVWEWTCTAWSKSYDGTEKRCVDSSSTAKRVYRGGSWGSGPRFVRSAMRIINAQGFRSYIIGFRLLRQ
ncbi:MAG: formylglycine-generating enzyme family protein, partial [Methylococcales bacterium]|nr:formylglycine-generating enzyme family protein [Methylococcales bacterium]